MNLRYTKKQLISIYKESIKEEIIETRNSKKISNKQLTKLIDLQIKKISLTRKEFMQIKKELLEELSTNQYSIEVNQTEKIISTLSNKYQNIKIDYKTNDTDPAIYYYQENNLYLINFDSIENKWYLSLIEKESLNLIKEIYSDYFINFLNYLKIKSH